MLTFLNHVVLFLTAVMAGKVCAANGYRNLGIAAFLTLESGYLALWFRSWWVAGFLMIIGTVIVLMCQRKVTDTSSTAESPK